MAGDAWAWGRDGHETVGYLTASLIAVTNAEKKVKALLDSGETLATAAEWADCAKGFNYCHKQPTSEMVDFAQRNPNHHSYHYTDIPFDLSEYSEDSIGASPDDVVHILEDAIRVLKGQAPANPEHDLTEREALFILAHMVGDIHQPLHVGAAYMGESDDLIVPQSQGEADAGFTQGGNLLCHGSKGVHSYWDSDLVTKAMKAAHVTTTKKYAAALLASAKKVTADSGSVGTWPTAWATEKLSLSKQELSVLTVTGSRLPGAKSVCQKTGETKTEGAVWDVEFPDDYATAGAVTAKEQLTKAGARLAKLLRAIWP